MKYKVSLTIISLFFGTSLFSQKNLNTIIDRIYDYQKQTSVASLFKESLIKLKKRDKLDFIDNCDTTFIILKYDYEQKKCIGYIWNNSGELDFTYKTYGKKKLKFSYSELYLDDFKKFIEKWDLELIAKYEKENFSLGTVYFVYAFRFIRNKDELDCIVFSPFSVP